MKQIFTTIALLAMAFSFASCEFDVTCNCNCTCGSTNNNEQNTGRPGNNDSDNNGGSNNDNTGNGGNTDNGGNTGSGDRSEYTTYNNTFTKGKAGYYGVYYEGQPSNTSNWYIELADNNYDFEEFEGDGFNVVLEFFANGTSSSSIPAGTYTIEAFEKSEFSAGSLLYGHIAEDDTYGDYPAGTWLYEGNEGVAAATAGELSVAVSGSTYTLKYTLYDDEYEVAFSGSYTGSLSIYDGTQEDYSTLSAVPATKSTKANTKYYRVRR
jgi:hypothetical protein